jgi:hypothetical protein
MDHQRYPRSSRAAAKALRQAQGKVDAAARS